MRQLLESKSLNLILISLLILSLTLTGCSSSPDIEEETEAIELIEPVGAAQSYDYATNRSLYDSMVLSSVVVPKVASFSAERDQYFDKYEFSCGDEVNKGDSLVRFRTEEVNKELVKLDEEIADFESDYISEVGLLNKRISDAEEAVYKANSDYMSNYSYEPPKDNEGAYTMFEKMILPSEGAYKRELLACNKLKEQLKEKTELYLLEHKYYEKKRELLIEKNSENAITSNVNGQVVAIGYYYDGDLINKDTNIVAVGDTSIKMLKTDYITRETIAKAYDVYAIVNGKRYELTYEPMDKVIYNQILNEEGVVYSSFYIDDANDEIKMGDYAVVVLIKDKRSDVLTIPQSALTKDGESYYVYCLDDNGASIYTQVDIGFRDGVYAEVLGGIKEGDKVITDNVPKKGKNTLTLAYDKCSTPLDTTGYLFYPTSEWMRNPVDTGTTYVKEICVEENEMVTKGQTLMKLEVLADDIEIDRLSREIDRNQTRLVKKLKKKTDNDAKNIIDRSLEESIISMQRTVDRDLRSLKKLTKYKGIIEIKAPFDGIINEKIVLEEGDLIYENDRLVRISNDASVFVIVKDTNDQLAFGNEAAVTYKDKENNQVTTKGRVVTVSNTALAQGLKHDYSLIAIPKDDSGDIQVSTRASAGNWDRAMMKVNVETRSMDNVLVIPKSAVSIENGKTYVNVVLADGSVKKTSFVSGGGNVNSYWVAEGLEEGMTICWE